MIAKSDLVILTISSLALVAGVYRWQQNVASPSLASAPAASRAVERAPSEPRDTLPAGEVAAAGTGARDASGRDAATSVAGNLADVGTRASADAPLVVRRLGTTDAPAQERAPTTRGTGPATARPIVAGTGTDVVASPSGAGERELYGVYRVRSGDYLGRIAEQFGTSVATLRRINGIDGSLIGVGDEIRYPLPAN